MAQPASIKAPDAFRTISEVAEELDLPQHVLRFWETRFAQIKPMKRGGGRRYYRPEDVDLLRGIRLLLYGQGFTIRGVQRLLKDKGVAFVVSVGQTGSVQTVTAADADEELTAVLPVERSSAQHEDRPAPLFDATPAGVSPAAFAEAAPPAPLPEPIVRTVLALSSDQRRRIESALTELVEARELLEQVR